MPQAMPEKKGCKPSLYPIPLLVLSGMMLILLVAVVTPKVMCDFFFFLVASFVGPVTLSLNLIVNSKSGIEFPDV